MFQSGALFLASAWRRGLPRLAAVALACLAASVVALAAAQGTPSIAVDSFVYEVGDTLRLSGQNLEPNATYVVRLIPPQGSSEEERTLEVSTDVRGGLRVDALLRRPGAYTVVLEGPRIDARLTVQVEGAAPGAGAGAGQPPGGAPAEGQDGAPGAEPDGAPDAEAEEAPAEGQDAPDGAPDAEQGAEPPAPGAAAPSQPEAGEPGAGQPDAEQPDAEQPDAEQPDGEQPDGEQPAAGQPGQADGEEPGQGEAAPPGEAADEAPGQPRGQQPGGQADEPGGQAEPEDDGPLSQAPVEPEQEARRPEVALDGESVVGEVDGEEVWRLTFGPSSGGTAGLLDLGEIVLVGHGNHLLEVEPLGGTVTARHRLPARVEGIEEDVSGAGAGAPAAPGAAEGANGDQGAAGGAADQADDQADDEAPDDEPAGPPGRAVVTVRYASGAEELFAWPPTDEDVRAFDPAVELYGWLRAEAEVADPASQLIRDPTNPWLYLAVAEAQPERSTTLRRNALARAQTFYEFAQLANAFLAPPDRDLELAAQAMDAALDDFVARGYRGQLLFDDAASAAYGFPRSSMRQALDSGDVVAADFWAPWLYRLSGDAVPENRELLLRYADDLRSRGRSAEAGTWEQRAATSSRFEFGTTVERAARALGATGWYGVIALLVAILALHLTLAAKYWRAQTVTFAARVEAGHGTGRAARLFTLRYATITEKLVLLLLFAAVMVLASLAGWVRSSESLPDGLGTGSLAAPSSQQLILESIPASADRDFALAYAAQTAGDETRAAELYRGLSDDADAMNNLGVLRGDQELYRLALELAPRHPEASYNLGLGENPSLLMAAYQPDEPLLAVVDRQRLVRATAGDHLSALGRVFADPWTTLTELRAVSPQWLWIALVVVFLAWVAWTLITLVIPRPAAARTAPRTFPYHLLALLLPGSGLADEFFGIVLLLPWAIFGIDTLLHFFAMGADPNFPLRTDLIVLAVIYLINTVAFIVEFVAYRRRMRELRAVPAPAPRAYTLGDQEP